MSIYLKIEYPAEETQYLYFDDIKKAQAGYDTILRIINGVIKDRGVESPDKTVWLRVNDARRVTLVSYEGKPLPPIPPIDLPAGSRS